MSGAIRKKSVLGRLGPIAAAAVLALGVSATASAGGYGHGPKRAKVVEYYDVGGGYRYRGGRHYRPKKVVRVYRSYRPPVVIRRPVVVVEQPYYLPPRRYAVVPVEAYPVPAPVDTGATFTPGLTPGALAGAAIGGLVGSQIGGGTGQLAATAAGAVGGFLLGDHVTRVYR